MVALCGQNLGCCSQVALVEDEGCGALVGCDTHVLEHEGSQEEVVDVEVGGEGWDLVADVVGSGPQSSEGWPDVHLGAGNGVVAEVDAQEPDVVKLVLGNLLGVGQRRPLQGCLLAPDDWAAPTYKQANFCSLLQLCSAFVLHAQQ